jgi:O-antigen/teichoic acid export membrane protein
MTSIRKTIALNSFWTFVDQIILRVIDYFIVILLARSLDKIGLGQYSFIVAFAELFFIFATFGLSNYVAREAAQKPKLSQKYFSEGLFFILLFSSIITIITTSSVWFIRHEWYITLLVFMISVSLTITKLIDHIGIFFKIKNKFNYWCYQNSIGKIIYLIGSLILFKIHPSVFFLCLILILSSLIRLFYSLYLIKKMLIFQFKIISFKRIKHYIKKGSTFLFSNVVNIIHHKFDSIMLSIMISDAVTGIYSAAYRLYTLVLMVGGIIINPIMPTLAKLIKSNEKHYKIIFNNYLRYLIYLSIPILAGGYLLSNELMSLYGNSFALEGSKCFIILLISIIFCFPSNLFYNTLYLIKKEKLLLKFDILFAFTNIFLNLVLIPKYTYLGAAFATFITYSLRSIILTFQVKSFIDFKATIYNILRSSLATSVMILFILNVLENCNVFLKILGGAISYFLIILLIGLEEEDKKIVKGGISFLKEKIKLY